MSVLQPNKNQVKHFVLNKDFYLDNRGLALTLVGYPACNCYRDYDGTPLKAFNFETAKTRRGITCSRCKKTKVFRKIK